MNLINKIFGKNTDNDAKVSKEIDNAASDTKGITTEESLKLYEFAKANASKEATEEIFRTTEKDSYYLDSKKEAKFDSRLMEFGFETPMELEAYLKDLWKEDAKMSELIPVVKVATFANRDKYDSKYKDLSLYNYTL